MNGLKVRAAGKRAGEVFLYGDIGDSGWGDGISAKAVADEIKALGQIDTLTVRINSPGGDVFDGFAIYNALVRHPAAVETHVDGMALSIASVIAMAGSTIHMAANALMMIHDPWTFAYGGADDLRKKADLMDQVKSNLVDTYANRTGQPAEYISQLMADETWLKAEDAKHLGFVTDITEELQIAASFDLSRFKKAPPQAASRPAVGNSIYRAKLAELERRAQKYGVFPG